MFRPLFEQKTPHRLVYAPALPPLTVNKKIAFYSIYSICMHIYAYIRISIVYICVYIFIHVHIYTFRRKKWANI